MLFEFLMFKEGIARMNDTANNMLNERKIHNYIRDVGYSKECERKFKKKYPKTYVKYEEAKEKWYRAFDATEEEYNQWKIKSDYERIIYKQNKLNEIEKEIKIIKKDVENQKIILEKLIGDKSNNV